MMSVSVMQLDSCVVTSLTVLCREGASDAPDDPSVTFDQRMQFSVQRHPSEPRFRLAVFFGLDWPADAATRFKKLEIGLVGEFGFAEGAPEAIVSKFVPEVCISNLYATARGLIAQATGLCPGGPFLLPLLNMRAILEEAQAAEGVDVAPPAEAIKGAGQRRAPRRHKARPSA